MLPDSGNQTQRPGTTDLIVPGHFRRNSEQNDTGFSLKRGPVVYLLKIRFEASTPSGCKNHRFPTSEPTKSLCSAIMVRFPGVSFVPATAMGKFLMGNGFSLDNFKFMLLASSRIRVGLDLLVVTFPFPVG